MQEQSRRTLRAWWARVFDVDPDRLWQGVTVHHHTLLEDYPGWWVAWRTEDPSGPDRPGVHVSAPATATAVQVARLEGQEVEDLADPQFWEGFAHGLDLRLVGPATHAYLDVDPGPSPGVEPLDADGLAELRTLVDDADWQEAGWADDPPLAWGLRDGGHLVAAANLGLWDGTPRDIGVVVVPSHRGRGLAAVVGRHAASVAVRDHGLARWVARHTNTASAATAARLDFEPWCTQLAIR